MKQYNDFAKIIHKEGYVFIVSFAAVTFLLGSFNSALGWIGSFATIWCIYFFRNPERLTPVGDEFVISPADGIVQNISESVPPSELNMGSEEMIKISIFLSVFNVHVNRIPASGKILALHYNPGKFLNASLDKASIYNERQSILMENNSGKRMAFVQIAGLIARRIVCDLEEGATVKSGERFGIIRFGSRMDVYLPLKTAILVSEGQTCVGGETVIANFDLKKTHEPKFEKR
jgi:phosphatidylserine decarboxylase